MRFIAIFLVFLLSFVSVNAYTVEFYHGDHLGSPSVITSSSGSAVWSADYDVFGETLNEEGNNKINYNSKEEDATGLLYYGARYYNPVTGRFITADTVKGTQADILSQNRYSYVQNNPLKYVDPTGNQEQGVFSEDNLKIQTAIRSDVLVYADAISSSAAAWGVDSKLLASTIYVERMQYQLDDARSFKETLLGNEFANWVLGHTGFSTGFCHIKAYASNHAEMLAAGLSVEVISSSGSMFPDSTRTLNIGNGFSETISSYNARTDEIFMSLRTSNPLIGESNIQSIDDAAAIFATGNALYAQAGVDISNSPDLQATVYNIGLSNAFPDSSRTPRVGGTTLPYILDGKYFEGVQFGERVGNVYRSDMFTVFDEPKVSNK
jgi:RHS repeat-associated protein